MKKKLTATKKQSLLNKMDILKGRLWELVTKMKEAGIDIGSDGQSAGRELENLCKRIENA